MSTSISINAYSSKENREFLKHYNAVKFCLENELSFPKETSEFFKGKVGGEDLEDTQSEYILDYIKNGIEIPLEMSGDIYEKRIKVSDIPPEVVEIIVKMS